MTRVPILRTRGHGYFPTTQNVLQMTHRITDTADANGRANSLVGIAGSNSTGGMDVCLL